MKKLNCIINIYALKNLNLYDPSYKIVQSYSDQRTIMSLWLCNNMISIKIPYLIAQNRQDGYPFLIQ